MKVEVKDGNLIVTLPIAPRPSSTGKSNLIASTSGYAMSTTMYEGKPIKVSLNAIVGKG